MRIKLDPDLCQGHGICCEEAPNVFSLDRDPPVRVLQEEPPEELREQVKIAVRYCPTGALRFQE